MKTLSYENNFPPYSTELDINSYDDIGKLFVLSYWLQYYLFQNSQELNTSKIFYPQWSAFLGSHLHTFVEE